MNNEELHKQKLETINVLSTVYQRIMSVNKDYDNDTKILLKAIEDKINSDIEALD